MFHSAQWDPAFDPAGKRIAVIGTGASAIQFVPELAKSAAQLTVFQRTPPWIIPRGDTPTSPLVRWLREHVPGYAWLVRQAIYWSLELRAYGFTVDTRLLALASRAAAAHLRAQVPDAALREKLTPRYAMGCKRILLSDDYYPALRRKNVTLVTDAIDRIAPGGVVTSDGTTHDVDAIVLGTGFRAQEFISPVQIFGIGGVSLDEAWKPFPRSYLGINVSGFPNLYFLIGPNTGLGHNSMVVMIEAQIAYVMSALKTMRARSVNAFDLKPAIERAFGDRIAQRTQRTVWASGCRSWYLDDRGQNTALWPGFTFTYRRMTSRFDPTLYDAV
jgi:cation diffusion facilitator CzcD-associated flavoprotein CzcO